MAGITKVSYFEQAATIATRTTVALAPLSAALYFKFYSAPSSSNRLLAASLAIVSGPSTLYCALGAIEGTLRSLTLKPKELITTYGLIRGAISPPIGYGIMANEWNKLGNGRDPGLPRVLKEEYYVYSAPRTAVKWTWHQLTRLFHWSVDIGTRTLTKGWEWACWGVDQVVSFVQWSWRVTQPIRTFAWNVVTTVAAGIRDYILIPLWNGFITGVEWTWNRAVDLWNITQPLRSVVKWVVWDIVIVNMICKALLKTFVWNWMIKTVLWDWIVTKLVWKVLIQTLIWLPVKFVWTKIVWPIITWTATLVANIFTFVFALIATATQAAFKLITRR